jgi:biopolymer transport protein ExbD
MFDPANADDDGFVAQINIIPLVDVVLVLLIIFMVTTVFARDNLKLDLPQGSRAEQMHQPPVEITVSVDRQGAIYVNGRPTPLEHLQARIQDYVNTNKNTTLVLRGDTAVIYGDMLPVLDKISASGVKLTLALKPGGQVR